jgi:hypothetical protein
MIPLSDAVYVLVLVVVAFLVFGWAFFRAWGRQAGWDWEKGEHEAAWAAEFPEPALGDFVTGVLGHEGQLAPPCVNCGSRIRYGCYYPCPGRVEPESDVLADEPGLDPPAEAAERVPSPAEMRHHADYQVWRTELGALIDGAWAWYDEAFATGQFRAVGR